jgi:hypothetical protein
MYAERQRAELERERLEEQARKAWAAEERKIAAEAAKETARQRREAFNADGPEAFAPDATPGSGRRLRRCSRHRDAAT